MRGVIQERGLAAFFRSVWGAPSTKVDAFGQILRDNGYEASRVVAIGDSMTEFWAAQELGIPFLGVVAEGSKTRFPADVVTRPSLKAVPELLGILRE